MKIVLTNVPEEQAATLARAVVESGFAACVNAFPVRSYYRWKGELTVDKEVTLLMKVSASGVERLRSHIKSLHPYELPEIVVLDVDVAHSLPEYVEWVLRECSA